MIKKSSKKGKKSSTKAKNKKKLKQPLWLVTLVGAFSLIFFTFFETGLEPIKKVKETIKFTREPMAHSDAPAEIYSNQASDDLCETFVNAMESAKKSIILIVYGLTDPDIIGCLKKKAEKGVQVSVICDAKANPQIDRKLGSRVKTTLKEGKGRGLMHQKILVVDDDKIWIGSANMTTESLKLHGNIVAAIRSPEMGEYVTRKAESMMQSRKSPPFLERSYLLDNQKCELLFLPDNTHAVDKMIQMINTAQKTIKVAMFTWTRKDFAKAIAAAQKRGVKVEVVLDQYAGKGASAEIASYLNRSGIPVSLSTGKGLLHYKMMIIDDQILVNGSANWTKSAFTQNDDCIMILHDLNERQNDFLKALWKNITWESKIYEDEFEAA